MREMQCRKGYIGAVLCECPALLKVRKDPGYGLDGFGSDKGVQGTAELFPTSLREFYVIFWRISCSNF